MLIPLTYLVLSADALKHNRPVDLLPFAFPGSQLSINAKVIFSVTFGTAAARNGRNKGVDR